MDPQSIQSVLGAAQVLLGVIFVLVSINLYLIFRLKDIDPFSKWDRNAINGALFMVFLVVGFIAAAWSSAAYSDQMMLVNDPASAHGVEIDRMFWRTMYVALFVTIITNVLLFYFAWKYRGKEGKKAYYYSHNNLVEIIWTAVPAVVLTALIVDGIIVWNDIMGDPPEDAIQVELTGEQFAWNIRYPGADTYFGETHVSYIDLGTSNSLGFNWDDENSYDDLVTQELHLPVDRDINLLIRSKDVLHSATLAHFRVKMDAVPGMTTTFNFKPTVTTEEMRKITGNPDFNYEMSCQQICGRAHYSMKKIVVVEPYADYVKWLSSQKPARKSWEEANGITSN